MNFRNAVIGVCASCVLMLATSGLSSDCSVRLTGRHDLGQDHHFWLQRPIVLRDGTWVVERVRFANGGDPFSDYWFLRPDGSIRRYEALGSAPAELRDGSVVVASEGKLLFLDSDGTQKRQILVEPGLQLSSPAELRDGTLAIHGHRANETGKIYFLSPEGHQKAAFPMAKGEGVHAALTVLRDQTTVIKTALEGALIFLNPDGTQKFGKVAGGGGQVIWKQAPLELRDGRVADFLESDGAYWIRFLDPKDGGIHSRIGFSKSSDLPFFMYELRNGSLVAGIAVDPADERLEFYSPTGTKLAEHTFKKVGQNVNWNIAQLADGTIVHGAGCSVYFLAEDGSFLEEFPLPRTPNGGCVKADQGPVVSKDGTIAIAGRDASLYFLKRDCAGFK